MSRDKGWMDVSEEEEGEENPGEKDERTEEGPKELQVKDKGCCVSSPFTPANSDSVFAMCTKKASDEEDVNLYDDNNNTDTECSSSFAASASSDGLTAACTNNENAGDEDYADKYDDKNTDEEHSNSLPVAFANSGCLVAAINNDKTSDDNDANENDDKELIANFTVTSANSEDLVASLTNNAKVSDEKSGYNIRHYVDINGNEEYIKSSAVTSTNGESSVAVCAQNDKITDKNYDEYDNDNENDCFATASINTNEIGSSVTDLTFGGITPRDEKQRMKDSSSEQELINQELEEEEEDYDDDDDEYDGSSSFEDSEVEDCDMYPKKLYSDPAYPGAVFQALQNMMLYSVLTDLTLFTEDGYQFQVHSFVLAAVSYLIQTRIRQKPKQEEFISLCLGPEVHGSGLAAVVEFAYTGNIGNLNKDNTEWIWSAAVSLEAPRILELCKEEEEREEDEAKGKKVDREEISAEEHMKMSLQHIRQMWTQRIGCDVELEVEGRVFHGKRLENAVKV